MRENIVFTLTGPDRVGIVETVTGMLLNRGGNVETSRMARLGGEFAILMLVSMPPDQLDGLSGDIEKLAAQGYKVTTGRTGRTYAEAHAGWLPYQIEVQGADHEGIIHEVSRYLSERGINIESMETETSHAPVSGAPLFSMTALVAVPSELCGKGWEIDLEEMGNQLNVDIKVSAAGKH
ncbi:MAG TPA: ACT domain-containing protein [Geobacteraceae bacterium]|nr:ACT domain-containing protein [Geobacteraceae bacterium]